MLKFIIAAVALLAVAGGLTYWTLGRGGDSAEAGVEVVRWGNVTVSVPKESGVSAVQGFAPAEIKPPDGGQVLILVKGESRLAIDADTGQVIQDTTEDADRAAIDAVLATLEVSEQDIATAPWPYSDMPPVMPRERLGNITYVPPDPASGIVISTVLADYFDERGSIEFIRIANAQSSMSVNTKTGLVGASGLDHVSAEDKEAFQRFLSEIELVAP